MMDITFAVQTEIARPAGDVFAVATDPARLHLWDPRVVEATVLDGGPVRAGSRIREVRKAGPRRLEQVVAVAAYEPPHRFGMRIEEGPFPVHGTLHFDALAGGRTRVRLHAHGTAPGPRVLAPLARALARRQMRAHQRRLKRLLEHPGHAPSTEDPAPERGL